MGETEKREPEQNETEQQPVQRESFNIEEMKDSLLQEGFEKKDIEAVIVLAKDISVLSKLVFKDNTPIVYVDEDESGKRRMAAYREPNKDNGIKEGYYIFMRGIVDSANHSMQNPKLWFDEDGKIRTGEIEQGGVAMTLDEFMFGLAAHEVRHRVQQKPDFKKIDMTEDMKKDYKDRESEKDASIAGYKATRALHNGKTIEQIAKIIGKVD